MWAPSGLGETIFEERYSHDGESWDEACVRVAAHVAKAETEDELRRSAFEQFYGELVENRFMPGGRIWYGAGRRTAQLLNCFVLPTADSREGWGKTVSDVIVVSGTGGGIGINCSPVRPRGSDIRGTGGKATGAVSLMQMINRVGDVIVGGGNRRTALMLALEHNHPDIEEFLNVKLDLDQLTNANISVILNTDPEIFAAQVREDRSMPLVHGNSGAGRSVRARKLWDTLVENAWRSGEPGVLNGYEANRTNNIFYRQPLVCTNPCGEIWLEQYGCCCLGALVLPRYVSNGRMDWDALARSVGIAVRFLDNVLSVNHYPLREIEENCQQVRRIGLGVMGLHTMLLELGYKYSGGAGLGFIDQLFDFIKQVAYDTSIDLAIEKGPFPAYDRRLLDSGYAKTLPRDLRSLIDEYGLRNCALLTIAPTGTTSMVAGVSSGIEPLFAPVYWRNYRKIDDQSREHKARELVVTPEFQRFGDLAEGAYDLSPRDHFQVQRTVQAHIDNAVSKTINLPQSFEMGQLSDIWLEYLPSIKGATFYREGSRGNEPLEYVKSADARRVIAEHNFSLEYHPEDQASMDCVGGVCSFDSKH